MKRPTRKQLIAATFEHSPGARILDVGEESRWVKEAHFTKRLRIAEQLLHAYGRTERLRTRALFYEHEGVRGVRYGLLAGDKHEGFE